jgi:hypothetical protein
MAIHRIVLPFGCSEMFFRRKLLSSSLPAGTMGIFRHKGNTRAGILFTLFEKSFFAGKKFNPCLNPQYEPQRIGGTNSMREMFSVAFSIVLAGFCKHACPLER